MPGSASSQIEEGVPSAAAQSNGIKPKKPRSFGAKAKRLSDAPSSMLLWPPLLISAVLLVFPQAIFLWISLHKSIGVGLMSETLSFDNYVRIFSDSFYLRALWVTARVSALATFLSLVVAFPCAYFLARLQSRIVRYLLLILLTTSFLSVAIKVLGLTLLLGDAGILNAALQQFGILKNPVHFLGNESGVVIGFIQHTLTLQIVILFSVVQTIAPAIEEAAEICGARWTTIVWHVLLPAMKGGLIACTVTAFSLNMGSFTSAVLLGGGRVPMLPVLIQQKIIVDVDYGLGAALSCVLLLCVFLLNWCVALAAAKDFGGGRKGP